MRNLLSSVISLLASLLTLPLLGQEFNQVTTTIVPETSPYFWLVPTINANSTSVVTNPPDWNALQPAGWSDPMTPPSQGSLTANFWRQGNVSELLQKGGLGYDDNTVVDFTPYLDLSSRSIFRTEIYGKETRANLRIPFTLNDSIKVADITRVELVLRFDDAVGVWIANSSRPAGVKLMSFGEPAFDAAVPSHRDDNTARTPAYYDVTTAFKEAVGEGLNVLCLRCYNGALTSADLMIQSKLVITQQGQNRVPTATKQIVPVRQDTPTAITLSGHDPEGEPLTFSIVDNNSSSKGVLSGVPPNLVYTPNQGYRGIDQFSFRVFDGASFSKKEWVTVQVVAPSDLVRVTSHPASPFTSYPRIHGLKAFHGRLYATYGDWNGYAACVICSFDPLTSTWQFDYSPGTDSLGVLRAIDGVLYAPHCDPIHYDGFYDFSYFTPGVGWRDRAPIGMLHAFDFTKMGDDLFFCGSKDFNEGTPNYSALMKSSNGGKNWEPVNPQGSVYYRYYWCFTLNGEVHTQEGRWTSTGWVNGSPLSSYERLYKPLIIPTQAGELMVGLANVTGGLANTTPSAVVTFDGVNAVSTGTSFLDLTYDGTHIYGLNGTGVFRGNMSIPGTLTWEALPITGVPSSPSCLEVMNGRVWIGDGSSYLWSNTLTGEGIPAVSLPSVVDAMPDGFGRSIVFDGPAVLVSSHEISQMKNDQSALLPAVGAVSGWTGVGSPTARNWGEIVGIKSPDPVISGWFGKDLCALDGVLGIVEAGFDLTGRDPGSAAKVHLYRRNPNGWVSNSILSIPFAHSVTMDSGMLVVGSSNPAANQASGAPGLYPYVLTRPTAGGPIQLTAKSQIKPVTNSWGYKSTVRCAMSDNYILGGFSGDLSRNGSLGMISLWNRAAVMTGSTAPAPIQEVTTGLPDRYGFAVALNSTHAVVSAPRDDTVANQAGAVYVYSVTGAAQPLVLQQKIVSPVAQDEADFGASVALFGDTMLIGAPGVDADGIIGRGAVYIYRHAAGVWTRVGEMLPPKMNQGGFGVEVALNDTWMAGGSRFTAASSEFTDRITLMPTLATQPDAYTAWAESRSVSPDHLSPTADPDGDGLNNLLEYAGALDPLAGANDSLSPDTSDFSGLPIVFLRPGTGTMIRYLARPQDLRFRQEFEISSDLSRWGRVELTNIQTIDSSGDVVLMEGSVPTTNDGKPQFVRLRVHLQIP